jgi:hypothetical protein
MTEDRSYISEALANAARDLVTQADIQPKDFGARLRAAATAYIDAVEIASISDPQPRRRLGTDTPKL